MKSIAMPALIMFVAMTAPVVDATAEEQDREPIDLLRSPLAKVERTTAVGANGDQLIALTDNDPSTLAIVPAQDSAPLDVVYGFGDDTVTLSSLVVQHSTEAQSASVEVLVSSLSPHTGFRSLRTCRISDGAEPQQFHFVATGARWIMLRLRPIDGESQIALAEVSVKGQIGLPTTRYAFNQSPAKALKVLSTLKELVDITITDDEQALFADARDGKFDDWTFAEAALIASGAIDQGARKNYLGKLDRLTEEANGVTEPATSIFEKGERLLSFLHAQPLQNGYQSEQTDLTTILDAGTYNCVSSATLYNVLARRLGLDARAIEVPDHAFSILYDGSRHADVEVTTDGGFNPSRDPAVLQKFTERTGKSYIADLHPERRREIGETGLVGIIYYNHGVSHSKNKEYDDALVRYFCALSLDPEFPSAVKNALSALANWGVELSDNKNFDEALAVVNAGLELAPEDATLLNNRLAIWHDHIEAAMDSGSADRALELVRQANQQLPGDDFESMESWVFLRPAEQLIEKAEWEEALAVAQSGIAQVNEEAKQELLNWCKGLFLRWSNSQLKEQEYRAALAVLERGLASEAEDPRMTNNVGYVVQEWSKQLLSEGKAADAEAMLTEQLKRHKRAGLESVATAYLGRRIKQLVAAEEFKAALESIKRCESFISDQDDLVSLRRNLYDNWSAFLSGGEKWEEAIAVYTAGLRDLSNDSHLLHNRSVTYQQWMRSHMDARQWLKAADVLERAASADTSFDLDGRVAYLSQESTRAVFERAGTEAAEKHLASMLNRFPLDSVRQVAAGHFYDVADKLMNGNRFTDAIAAVQRGEKLVGDNVSLRPIAHQIYDRQSRQLAEQKKWSSAVEVYAEGLRQYPDDSHLTHNAVVAWNDWASTHLDAQEWAKAVEIYERALKAFPDESLLQKNLAYSKQQESSE